MTVGTTDYLAQMKSTSRLFPCFKLFDSWIHSLEASDMTENGSRTEHRLVIQHIDYSSDYSSFVVGFTLFLFDNDVECMYSRYIDGVDL